MSVTKVAARSASPTIEFDPFGPVSLGSLPPELLAARTQQDWARVREILGPMMDGAVTDGPYGPALLAFVRTLPLGVYPVFDRYRAIVCLDFGDWADLERCLSVDPVDAAELRGVRDVWLAPIDRVDIPPATEPHHVFLLQIHEFAQQRNWRATRHWTRRAALRRFKDVVLQREDVPKERHFRYRNLQDAWNFASCEANGGRLTAALGFARRAQGLGDEREPLRIGARDLEHLVAWCMGEGSAVRLEMPRRTREFTAFSPLGTWELLNVFMPFLAASDHDEFEFAARTVDRIADRMASPRAQLQAEAWLVALALRRQQPGREDDLAALLLQARAATPGLRALPTFLDGYAHQKLSAFVEALELARRSGAVWLQVSSLLWLGSLNPTPWVTRSLARLLETTGWRRPALVPTQVVADASLGLVAAGHRSRAIVELAERAGQPNVTLEVASRHLEPSLDADVRGAALHALHRLGTTRARDHLERTARRTDDALSSLARSLLHEAAGLRLTERELEVLGLAGEGLTDREIAARLGLSEHTVARHIVNARSKLGAANRTEAVGRLHSLGGPHPEP